MSDNGGALGMRKRKRSLGEDDSLLPSEEETDSIASVGEDEYADSCSADDYGDLLGGEDEVLDNTAEQSVPIRMRPDVARRIRENKNLSFVTVKMAYGAFVPEEGRMLLGLESVLVDINKGVLECYDLLNLHVVRLCRESMEIQPFGRNYVRQFLSAVMTAGPGSREPPLDQTIPDSLELYRSYRHSSALRASRADIKFGFQNNVVTEILTTIHNSVQITFLRRFNKFAKVDLGVDGRTAWRLVNRIIAPEPSRTPPGATNRQRDDDFVETWRGEIPRKPNGQLNYAPHLLVPLTYRSLERIEEHNEAVRRRAERARGAGTADEEVKRILREVTKPFTIMPTKKGFSTSHVKIDLIELRELTKRSGHRPPNYNQWSEVKHLFWKKFFRIDKVETGNRKFANEISTDGKSISVRIRKPKNEVTTNPKEMGTADYDDRWGLDPGRTNLFVATNQLGETISCSGKEFREDAHYIKSEQKINRWTADRPDIQAVCDAMPTKKTASLDRLGEHINFKTQHMDLLLTFHQQKPFRRLRLRRYIFKKKKMQELCRKLARPGRVIVIGFGDFANLDPNGVIRGHPLVPVKEFAHELAKTRGCNVISIDEYRPSQSHYECSRRLSKQYPYCRRHNAPVGVSTFPVYSVLHCRNNGSSGTTVHKDVNASKNMLRLLDCELDGQPRPAAYAR